MASEPETDDALLPDKTPLAGSAESFVYSRSPKEKTLVDATMVKDEMAGSVAEVDGVPVERVNAPELDGVSDAANEAAEPDAEDVTAADEECAVVVVDAGDEAREYVNAAADEEVVAKDARF